MVLWWCVRVRLFIFSDIRFSMFGVEILVVIWVCGVVIGVGNLLVVNELMLFVDIML